MDWGTVWTLVIGSVLALASGAGGQWLADRRAAKREAQARAEDRRDDRIRWARGHQMDAHLKFLADFDAMATLVSRRQEEEEQHPTGSEPPGDLLVPLWNRMTFVRMVSDRATIDAAEKAMQALRRFVFEGAGEAEVDWYRDEYLAAIRSEFDLGTIQTMQEQVYDQLEAEGAAAGVATAAPPAVGPADQP